jgi:AcrR family transcriptional regulator
VNVHSSEVKPSSGSGERPQKILEATLGLVSEHGLTGLSIAKIAARANASPGIIYHYFEGKDALIHALYGRVLERYAQGLGEAVYELSALARLKRLWHHTFRFYADHPEETVFLEQYKNSAYYAQRDPALDAPLARLIETVQADIAGGALKDLPIGVIQAMTLEVAISLAKAQVAGTLQLDEKTLEMVADTVCHAAVR